MKKEMPSNGGLYAKVNMSLKTANMLVLAGVLLLVFVTLFTLTKRGFNVNFDTDGGSYVQSVKAMYSDKITKPEDPVKEGYSFLGWYKDRLLKEKWDFNSDTVESSMTLYAGWEKSEKNSGLSNKLRSFSSYKVKGFL